MTLEDPAVLKEKNRKRLRDVYNSAFVLGINVTAPSKFKDSLRIIAVILIFNSCICVYGHFAYIIRHKDSLLIQAESICTLLQTLVSIFKMTYFVFEQRRFYLALNKVQNHELVDQVDFLTNETPFNTDLRKDAVKILDASWKYAKAQFNFYMFACSAIISYYFIVAVTKNFYHARIGTPNYSTKLPFPIILQFMESKMAIFPYYQIALFIGSSGDYIAGICALCFDGIFIILALHGVALYRILGKMIVFTTSPNVPKELRIDYLRQCIFHFERTYQYCTNVNNLYLHMSLTQFLMSLAIFGLVMFQGLFGLVITAHTSYKKTGNGRMVLYIAAAGYEVILYCLNGQYVTSESEIIQLAWYQCEWYSESREFKELIKMMIMRSNRPMLMRASWFSTMSLPTLLAIIKTSGSYFLLLRNLAY